MNPIEKAAEKIKDHLWYELGWDYGDSKDFAAIIKRELEKAAPRKAFDGTDATVWNACRKAIGLD